jgi:hypothetical protein
MSVPPGAPGPDWSAVFRKKDELVTRTIAGETLVVPVSGRLADLQRIFALEGTAGFIWERLDGRRSLGQIRDELQAGFAVAPGDVERDLLEFVGELAAAGLVRPV